MEMEKNNVDIIRIIRVWTLDGFLRNKKLANIGDKVQLPSFKVSAAVIGGKMLKILHISFLQSVCY